MSPKYMYRNHSHLETIFREQRDCFGAGRSRVFLIAILHRWQGSQSTGSSLKLSLAWLKEGGVCECRIADKDDTGWVPCLVVINPLHKFLFLCDVCF